MRKTVFIVSLALLSILSGWLMSKASLTGKVGMSLFYTEYNFLKVWWQGAALLFIILFLLYVIQGLLERNRPPGTGKTIHVLCITLALAGLYFTYYDFRHTLSHRLLGERF